MAAPFYRLDIDDIPTVLTPWREVRMILARYFLEQRERYFLEQDVRLAVDPEEHIFSLWWVKDIEVWGRREHFDTKLVRIEAPSVERQLASYDRDELRNFSCLRSRHGDTFYDIHVKRLVLSVPDPLEPGVRVVVPLGREISQRQPGWPRRYYEIKSAYLALTLVDRDLCGLTLCRAIWRKLYPDRKDTDRAPPGLSEESIGRALPHIKDGH